MSIVLWINKSEWCGVKIGVGYFFWNVCVIVCGCSWMWRDYYFGEIIGGW